MYAQGSRKCSLRLCAAYQCIRRQRRRVQPIHWTWMAHKAVRHLWIFVILLSLRTERPVAFLRKVRKVIFGETPVTTPPESSKFPLFRFFCPARTRHLRGATSTDDKRSPIETEKDFHFRVVLQLNLRCSTGYGTSSHTLKT